MRQVDELVSQVSTASREQNQGVGQINAAVMQMDKVVQSNAAAAEEGASAAEQLNGQAGALTKSAQDLMRPVGRASTRKAAKPARPGVASGVVVLPDSG